MQLKFNFLSPQRKPQPLLDEPMEEPQVAVSPTEAAVSAEVLEQARRRLSLELRLHLGTNVAVVLHQNRQSMLTAERTRLGYLLRMHRIFATASSDVVHAIARFVDRNDRHGAMIIDNYIDASALEIARQAKPAAVRVEGRFFHLQALFDELNARYFSGAVKSRITWGRAAPMRRRSIKLGSYHANEQLIRIHPALDQSFVPAFFVEFVVFHEMLHEQLGTRARSSDGRRCVHPPEFRALEARFPQAEAALRWERENVGRLLRFRPD